MLTCHHAILLGAALLPGLLVAQIQQPAEPAVPSDPLELITGNAQPVQDVSQRAEIINLLLNAHRISNVRAQPYDLKTTFTASGAAASSGLWQVGRPVGWRILSLDSTRPWLFGCEPAVQ